MRKIFLFTLIAAALAPVPYLNAAEQTVSFDVRKMTCALCPITVRKAMERLDGVSRVEVDFEHKSVTVTFDDGRTTVAEIALASTNAGYPATPAGD